MAKIFSLKEGKRALKAAVKALEEGLVVAIPTETFYGLAVDYLNEKALKRLFFLKRRPEGKPVLLLLGDKKQVEEVACNISPLARKLMDHFWPGPLTLVLPARSHLPPLLTAHTKKVAVRLSSHEFPCHLARSLGRPITGTSANLSGMPPARSVDEILAQLPDVDLIIDGGTLPASAPSTIVEVSFKGLKLLRKGKVPWSEILKITGGDPSQ